MKGCQKVERLSSSANITLICSQEDWREHKAICKAFKSIEGNPTLVLTLRTIINSAPSNLADRNRQAQRYIGHLRQGCKAVIGRPVFLTIGRDRR